MVRRLTWGRPAVYFPFGILRKRGNVFRSDHELYIGGYPRSGNTFALKAFLSANPGTLVRSHLHIPAFIVQSAKCNWPGMVLVRNPSDAAISWAIYKSEPLRETLGYYIDYYSVLLSLRDTLLFVSFEEVITDFGNVIRTFNSRWGATFVPFQHTPENVSRCVEQIEAEYLDADGKVIESRVPRPSFHRRAQKESLLRQLNRSPVLQKELRRAQELHQMLMPRNFAPGRPRHNTNTTQSIRLRPAV
jgi:hypothetical protein